MKKRSVAAVVILTIITFGIYGCYWVYVTCEALQKESDNGCTFPPVFHLLFYIFISAAGGALLGYDGNLAINKIKSRRGMKNTDNMLLWIILGAVINVVLFALIQYEINQIL